MKPCWEGVPKSRAQKSYEGTTNSMSSFKGVLGGIHQYGALQGDYDYRGYFNSMVPAKGIIGDVPLLCLLSRGGL